jgi:hypothetical protein
MLDVDDEAPSLIPSAPQLGAMLFIRTMLVRAK